MPTRFRRVFSWCRVVFYAELLAGTIVFGTLGLLLVIPAVFATETHTIPIGSISLSVLFVADMLILAPELHDKVVFAWKGRREAV